MTFVNHESSVCHEKTVMTVIHTAKVARTEMDESPVARVMLKQVVA